MRFHGRVYELAGTEVLSATWAVIESTIRKFILLAAPLYVADLHEAADHHIPLLRSLEVGDLELLRAEVPQHLTNLFKRMRLETSAEEA